MQSQLAYNQKCGAFTLCVYVFVCFAPWANWWHRQQTFDPIKKLPWSSQRVRPSLWGQAMGGTIRRLIQWLNLAKTTIQFYTQLEKVSPDVICLLWFKHVVYNTVNLELKERHEDRCRVPLLIWLRAGISLVFHLRTLLCTLLTQYREPDCSVYFCIFPQCISVFLCLPPAHAAMLFSHSTDICRNLLGNNYCTIDLSRDINQYQSISNNNKTIKDGGIAPQNWRMVGRAFWHQHRKIVILIFLGISI